MRFDVLQQRQRFVVLAFLLQLGRVQQGHARLFGEAAHHLVDDALGQRRALHAQRKPAEFLPGFDLIRDGAGLDQVFEHVGRGFRLAAAVGQGDQRKAPATRVGLLEQAEQVAACGAQVVAAQGQRGLGAAHGHRRRCAGAPQRQRFDRARVVVGQHGDAGGALGQPGIAGLGLGGVQVGARGIVQLPGLQGEFAGKHGFQRRGAGTAWRRSGRCFLGCCGGTGGHCDQQKNTQDANRYRHRGQPGRKMGP